MNSTETLTDLGGEEEEELTRAVERQRCADEIWSEQVDAAAVVGAEVKVDGGARMLERREEEDKTKKHGGSERDPRSYL